MSQTEQKPELKELEPKAKELLARLKIKHKDTATSNALEIAADAAYKIWYKAASENTLTGIAQLDERSGVSSMERYLLARLPKK